MVDLEKLEHWHEHATAGTWVALCSNWDGALLGLACQDDDPDRVGCTDGTMVRALGGNRLNNEISNVDALLACELRNNCAAIVAELRAARELAITLRRVCDQGVPVRTDARCALEEYEAARDGGWK